MIPLLLALEIEDIMTAPQSPWQNPYAERVIGSIRRECLAHMVILGELHLKRILADYAEYYHSVRTRLNTLRKKRLAALASLARVHGLSVPEHTLM